MVNESRTNSERITMQDKLKAVVRRSKRALKQADNFPNWFGDSVGVSLADLALMLDALEGAETELSDLRLELITAHGEAQDAYDNGYRAGLDAGIKLLESECEDSAVYWLQTLLPSEGK